jgi:hypothetical protein
MPELAGTPFRRVEARDATAVTNPAGYSILLPCIFTSTASGTPVKVLAHLVYIHTLPLPLSMCVGSIALPLHEPPSPVVERKIGSMAPTVDPSSNVIFLFLCGMTN